MWGLILGRAVFGFLVFVRLCVQWVVLRRLSPDGRKNETIDNVGGWVLGFFPLERVGRWSVGML